MKGLALFGLIAFGTVGTVCIIVAIVAKSLPYACLSGVLWGVAYVAFTDYRKAVKEENIFNK